jgi:hypothetical protein
MTYSTIQAAGQILSGTTILDADIARNAAGQLMLRDGEKRVDVTHVWHAADLAAIVAALLSDEALPSGYHRRTRRDGVAMVGRDR